jgi:diguanylate cyclase (GGDEF)-like protein
MWKNCTGGAKFELARRLASVAAILFASILAGWVAAQAPLTALTAIRQLSSAEAGKGLPVTSQTAVTHFHPNQRNICAIDCASPLVQDVHFQILPQSPEYIAGLAEPGWQNSRNLMLLAWLLLIVVLAVGMRGWYLEHKTRRQIGSLAYVEQRRSRILEDINHSKPLAEILERITELVSVRLSGAPCWCQIADGASLGNRPTHLTSDSLRTVEHPIASPSGPPLGAIFAAFHARSKPNPAEKEALAMAAGLATLAIKTSRLYSDLVHRSEFDLLTDVPNRFAMEKALAALIEESRQSAAIFGVIYVDLNGFKQVNDEYGHQFGDMYLKEIARRMKRQLRPGDTLARLGGDEFAVLVSEVRNRAAVEEIATRLQCCFLDPFEAEGYVVDGSASVGIALYPEDADTADGLLSSADAAMYVAKYNRMGKNGAPQAQPEDQFAPKEQAEEKARLAPGLTDN